MTYVFILLFMVVLRILLPRDTKRDRVMFSVVVCLLLCFFAACRAPEVGRDTASFIDVFLKLRGRSFLDIFKFSSWVEPGFRILCAIVGLFTANGQWLIVVSSLIIHISVSVFIYRHVKNIYLGFFLYLTMMIYPFYFSMMRQALAVCVLLFAYTFLKKKRWVPYVLLVFLAASFHTSAIVFLLCPFLLLIPVNSKTLRVLLPVTGILAVLGVILVRPAVSLFQMLFPRYAEYEATTFDALYCYFAVFAVITAYGIFRLYYSKTASLCVSKTGAFDEKGFLTLMMLIGVVVAAMMTQFGQIQRMFHYFEVIYLLWLPMVTPPAFYHREKRHIAVPVVTLAISVCCVAYFLVILFLRSGLWYDAMPYRFFWQ